MSFPIGSGILGRGFTHPAFEEPVIPEPEPTCEIADSYARTVSSGWGMNDAGVLWEHTPSSGVSSEVDGGEGRITCDESIGAIFEIPITDQDFKMRCTFRVDNPPPGANLFDNLTFILRTAPFGSGSTISQFRVTVCADSANGIGYGQTLLGVGSFDEDFDWAFVDGVYHCAYQRDSTGATRAKMWEGGDIEPDWQLTVTDTGTISYFVVDWENATDSWGSQSIFIDDISCG